MSVKKVKDILMYYCQVCGWSISKKLLNEITGKKEDINYCTECGAELIKGNIISDKEFVIKNNIDLERDINITLIKKDLDLPFHRSHIKEITDYLKKRYSS